VGAVGVALDRPEEPGRWIGELPQQGTGRDRRFIASDDLLHDLVRVGDAAADAGLIAPGTAFAIYTKRAE